ncbi:MAG: helicase associated domain-containing protein [Clostridia bacterium]|nr:helicase associated domain-containing protein [Clostridia bacterium]
MKYRTFDEWYEDFVKYTQYGNVAQNYITPEGYKLGHWVSRIRNRKSKLTQEQKKRLDEAGFVWKIWKRRTFDEWFADFVKYKEGGNIDRDYVTPDGYKLGVWVNNVRSGMYKLTAEQQERLKAFGFVFSRTKHSVQPTK